MQCNPLSLHLELPTSAAVLGSRAGAMAGSLARLPHKSGHKHHQGGALYAVQRHAPVMAAATAVARGSFAWRCSPLAIDHLQYLQHRASHQAREGRQKCLRGGRMPACLCLLVPCRWCMPAVDRSHLSALTVTSSHTGPLPAAPLQQVCQTSYLALSAPPSYWCHSPVPCMSCARSLPQWIQH